MATKIEFDFKGEHYTLEFDAASAKQTIKKYKINLNSLTDDLPIMASSEEIFFGALMKHHPTLEEEKAHEIFEALSPENDESENIYVALVQMLIEACNNIAKPSGNAKWKMVKQ